MKLLITRPVVITGDGGTRSFVPGLTVEVDAATADQILAHYRRFCRQPGHYSPDGASFETCDDLLCDIHTTDEDMNVMTECKKSSPVCKRR